MPPTPQAAIATVNKAVSNTTAAGATHIKQTANDTAALAKAATALARPVLGSWVYVILKVTPRLECNILPVKPSAQTHSAAPHCGSHCH